MSVEGPQAQVNSQEGDLYQQMLGKLGREHRLFSVHWELTYRCNQRCSHCYLDVLPPSAKLENELTTQECLGIVDQIAEAGVLNLTLSGGEILVRGDLFEIAAHARSRHLLLRLFTNGVGVTASVADRIAELHPYAVEISLYSTHPELHERITSLRRSWELTTRALRLLHERGVRTVMKTPLMRENVYEIDQLEALAQELGASFRYDITITPKDSGALDPLQHRMSYDDLVWLMRRRLDPAQWKNRQRVLDQPTCNIAQKALAIDPYGNVSPCVEVRKQAGNLREQSLQEIWENSPVWKEMNGLKLSELPVCRECELSNYCFRCHGLAAREDGDLHGPAYVNCMAALARRQVLIEKGNLPEDYPIPEHLVGFAQIMKKGEYPGSIPLNGFLMQPSLNLNQRLLIEASSNHRSKYDG